MPFAAFIPFIIIGIVIAFARRSAEQQRKQQEARRRAAQAQTVGEQKVPTINRTPQPTVRPTVQVPEPAREVPRPLPTNPYVQSAAPKAKPAASALKPRTQVRPQPAYEGVPVTTPMHKDHDLCAVEEDPKGSLTPHAAVSAVSGGGTLLDLKPDNIVRGVLFSEIFGKPKARR